MTILEHKKFFWTLALFLVSIVWGSSFLVIKNIVQSIPPESYLVLRFGIAGFILMIVVLLQKYITKHTRPLLVIPGVFLGILLSCVYFLSTYGVEYTSASNATLISNLFMVFTPLLGMVLLKTPLARKYIYGSILGFVGFIFISGISSLQFHMGDGIILMSALFLALHLLLTEYYGKKYHSMQLLLTETFVVLLISIVSLFFTGGLHLPAHPVTWIEILYLALFSTVFAFGVIAMAEKQLHSTQTAMIISLQGIWALLLAISLNLEVLTIPKLIGVACMTMAIFAIEVPYRKHHI